MLCARNRWIVASEMPTTLLWLYVARQRKKKLLFFLVFRFEILSFTFSSVRMSHESRVASALKRIHTQTEKNSHTPSMYKNSSHSEHAFYLLHVCTSTSWHTIRDWGIFVGLVFHSKEQVSKIQPNTKWMNAKKNEWILMLCERWAYCTLHHGDVVVNCDNIDCWMLTQKYRDKLKQNKIFNPILFFLCIKLDYLNKFLFVSFFSLNI